jgi:hypothetical protein
MIPRTYDRERVLKYYDTDNPEELAFLQDTFQVRTISEALEKTNVAEVCRTVIFLRDKT